MDNFKNMDELYFYFQSCMQHRENGNSQKTLESVGEMEHLAYYDALTDLKNRRAFEKDAGKMAAEKIRFWIISVDANNLKKINDAHGHQCGDAALKEIAASMIEIFGKERSYRFGGDEFAATLAGENQKECLDKMAGFKNCLLGKETASVPVCAAIGAALCTDGSYLETLGKADKEMYRDKEKWKKQKQEENDSFREPVLQPFSVSYGVFGTAMLYALAVLAVIFLN